MQRSQSGLDWTNFFVATVQTGFGPFVAVYLTTKAWTGTEIGEALSLGTVAALLTQLPGGALVDRLADKRLVAVVSVVLLAASALLFAAAPSRAEIFVAEILHSAASSMLGPCLAAISLALVGRAALGERLGRNARFASLGNGLAAAALGAIGAWLSNRAVFWLTAGLVAPCVGALLLIRRNALTFDPAPAGPRPRLGPDIWALLTDARVLGFAGCVALFHLSNAAQLPLAGSELTRTSGSLANIVIAASILLPQAVVAAVSPWVGREADRIGRRAVLLVGFAALPVRALLLSTAPHPAAVVAIQMLDGVSASVLGVLGPLVVADLTAGTRRFNLCLGVVGLATAAGATLSTLLAGLMSDQYGQASAFLALAGAGVAGVLAVWGAVPGAPAVAAAVR